MVLKETLLYYVSHNSAVYCTFLGAKKAFDRIQYCKLFRLLMERGLPSCITRVIIGLYLNNFVRVAWNGVMSGTLYFSCEWRQTGKAQYSS